MKKVVVSFLILFLVLGMSSVYATDVLTQTSQLEETTNSELVEIKSKSQAEIENYQEIYGSEFYGFTAYVLNKIRIFSIPVCFLGIALGAVYQYVIGIRRMDLRDKGFFMIISFVTILVICQVIPLIFAIIVQGWRG